MVSVKAGAWKWVGLADGQMSALGQKQTCAAQKVMSALPPKADMCSATSDVRLVPKADIAAVLFDQWRARAPSAAW